MQIARYLKWGAKKWKKYKAKRALKEKANRTKSIPSSPTTDKKAWTCPALEAISTEAKPLEIESRRPSLLAPPVTATTLTVPVVNAPAVTTTVQPSWMPYDTSPEYRLNKWHMVYLRLKNLDDHCGYDMVRDALEILEKKQKRGEELWARIANFDYDYPMGRPVTEGIMGRRVSMVA